MRKDRLTPRKEGKKTNRSISPQNAANKSKLKSCFAAQKHAGKENESVNSHQQESIKICLDLANYHKNESEELKHQNGLLEGKFNEQMRDMEDLRSQLETIKVAIQGSQGAKKVLEGLKTENTSLKRQNELMKTKMNSLGCRIEELVSENMGLKARGKEADSILIEADSKCNNFEISPLTFAKESRRQEYANRYECMSFVPSVVCLECKRKDNDLEDAREKYGHELRQLQEQVSVLTQNQIAIEGMERQLLSKNECIDYLMHQLNLMESDSQAILRNMTHLEARLRQVTEVAEVTEVTPGNPPFKSVQQSGMFGSQPSDRLCHSFSKSLA